MNEIGSGSSTRRRFTPLQRATLLSQYRRSDHTQRAFVEIHGLSLATLGKWLRQERQSGVKTPERKGSPRFKAVNLTPMFGVQNWAAEVALAEGAIVRLSAHASAEWATELLQAVRRSC